MEYLTASRSEGMRGRTSPWTGTGDGREPLDVADEEDGAGVDGDAGPHPGPFSRPRAPHPPPGVSQPASQPAARLLSIMHLDWGASPFFGRRAPPPGGGPANRQTDSRGPASRIFSPTPGTPPFSLIDHRGRKGPARTSVHWQM